MIIKQERKQFRSADYLLSPQFGLQLPKILYQRAAEILVFSQMEKSPFCWEEIKKNFLGGGACFTHEKIKFFQHKLLEKCDLMCETGWKKSEKYILMHETVSRRIFSMCESEETKKQQLKLFPLKKILFTFEHEKIITFLWFLSVLNDKNTRELIFSFTFMILMSAITQWNIQDHYIYKNFYHKLRRKSHNYNYIIIIHL